MLKELIKSVLPASIWRSLQKYRHQKQLDTFPKRIVTHRYTDYSFKVSLEDPLAEGWYDHDWPSMSEIEELKKGKLKKGAVVFDVGAHQGVVALILAKIVSETGKVIALEASPHSAQVAERNRQLNGVNQLTVLHAAGGSTTGELDFGFVAGQVAQNNGSDARVKVKSYCMDDLAKTYGIPQVLFVDVEGYEVEVLKGSSKILAKHPDCYIEVHTGLGLEDAGGSVDQVLGFFPESIYRLLIRPANAGEFEPLNRNSPIIKNHFYLLAINRNQIAFK